MKRYAWPAATALALAVGFAWGIGVAKFGAFPHDHLASIMDYRSPTVAARRDYFAGYNGRPDVVIVGDSILRSVEWSEELAGTVVNRAIDGDTTADALERVSDLARLDAPQYVIMLGTNDRLRGIPPEQTARNLQRIVDALPGRKLLINVPPCRACGDVAALNARIGAIRGANHAVTSLSEADLVDGIHPGVTGIVNLARDVKSHLTPPAAMDATRDEPADTGSPSLVGV